MQVQTINIPLLDNDGSDNAPVIEATISRFIDTFGGATVLQGQGYWKEGDTLYAEPVAIIQGATESASTVIDDIARDVLSLTDQLAVYVVSGGNAKIIPRE